MPGLVYQPHWCSLAMLSLAAQAGMALIERVVLALSEQQTSPPAAQRQCFAPAGVVLASAMIS